MEHWLGSLSSSQLVLLRFGGSKKDSSISLICVNWCLDSVGPLSLVWFQSFSKCLLHRVIELTWWLRALSKCVLEGRKCLLRTGLRYQYSITPNVFYPLKQSQSTLRFKGSGHIFPNIYQGGGSLNSWPLLMYHPFPLLASEPGWGSLVFIVRLPYISSASCHKKNPIRAE